MPTVTLIYPHLLHFSRDVSGVTDAMAIRQYLELHRSNPFVKIHLSHTLEWCVICENYFLMSSSKKKKKKKKKKKMAKIQILHIGERPSGTTIPR